MNRIMKRQMGYVDRIVRDHLYDQTKPGAPRARAGITVNEMLANVNEIRSSITNAGAIRRSLRNIQDAGLATHSTLGGSRTLAWKWNTEEAIPKDYQYRPLKKIKPGVPETDKRLEALDDLLFEKLRNIEGNIGEEKKKKVPDPKIAEHLPVIRPNGDQYFPRELAGFADVETIRELREAGLPLLMSGPPGGGKTALLEAAFGETSGGLHIITGDAGTKVEDFLGQWYPTGKPDEMYWADGPLVLAMRAGGVLFIDDATLIDTKEIACLYPAMDGRGEIRVKAHPVLIDGKYQPDIVQAQPGFYVVAAHNPGVTGAILSDALSSRFTVQVWLESDLQLARTLGVSAKAVKLALNMRTRRENGDYGIFVPEMRDLIAFRDIHKKFGEMAACENLLGRAPKDFQDEFSAEIKTAFDFKVNPRRLEVGERL